MLRLLALFAMAAPALATSPPDELVEEIAELRKQVGEHGEVEADEKDFAEALRRVASDQPDWNRQPPRPEDPHAMERSFPSRRPDRGGRHRDHDPFGHHLPVPPHRPHGPRPPQVMLREAAFELDRLAHGLEMAELFDDADALRDTANRLRRSARKGPSKPDPGPARGRGRVSDRGDRYGSDPSESHKAQKAKLLREAEKKTKRMVQQAEQEAQNRLPQEARDLIRKQGEARDRFYREQARRLQPPQPPQPAEPPRPEDE